MTADVPVPHSFTRAGDGTAADNSGMASFAKLTAARGFVSVVAPQGVECWTGVVDVAEGIAVSIVVETPATTAELDVTFIATVLNALPMYLSRAAAAVSEALGNMQGYNSPADWGPEVTFFAGREWTVRFADIPEPGLEELGVMVFFNGYGVTAVSDLSAAEEVV